MNNYSPVIDTLAHDYDEKKRKRLSLDLFSRLCKKLEEESNHEVDELIRNSYELLRDYSRDDEASPKEYKVSLSKLRKKVKEVYGYTAKGELKEQYTGMGIALGVAFGSAFLAVNVALIGVGLPIGLAIGVAIGQQKEQEAEKQGKIY